MTNGKKLDDEAVKAVTGGGKYRDLRDIDPDLTLWMNRNCDECGYPANGYCRYDVPIDGFRISNRDPNTPCPMKWIPS